MYRKRDHIHKIVIAEWKGKWFVALKTRLMHREIVWQKKIKGTDKRPHMEKAN